jgi:hypothetical protein
MQRDPFYSNVLQILVLLLHFINLLSSYLEFCNYLTILIFPILQLCFELLLLFQSSLQLLNRFILILYNMLVFLSPYQKIQAKHFRLYILFYCLLKHNSNSSMFIQFCYYPLHKPWCMKPKSLTLGTYM